MEASNDSCHDCRERVKALGTEVVPEVSPMRNEAPGGPSARPSTCLAASPGNTVGSGELRAIWAAIASCSCCGHVGSTTAH